MIYFASCIIVGAFMAPLVITMLQMAFLSVEMLNSLPKPAKRPETAPVSTKPVDEHCQF